VGESFGSQIAWAMLDMGIQANDDSCFNAEGLVLAGGFVKHPWKWGPGVLRRISQVVPTPLYRAGLITFGSLACLYYHNQPELLRSINEFTERRTELDRQAMRHRLTLLDRFDPREIARQIRLPVYYLGGLADPLVPWFQVKHWLRRNCPGYKGGRILWWAGHNVLHTSPAYAAALLLQWMKMSLS